ncbi:MAG TPA: NADH-quinone oxidoreductase subunit NuoH [Chloroflexota bacterium]|nr:NADH-quinone oxidoreductase subunit NuoH [Chloroflexota bacterium]
MSWQQVIFDLIIALILVFVLITGFAYMTFAERRVVALMQVRIGPNRVGPFGLLQPLADGIKLLFKEDIVPTQADKPVFALAPMFSLFIALVAFAVIPFTVAFSFTISGNHIAFSGALADLNIGVLYVFAATSLAVYGIVLGGWASNNKYSLLGGIRSSAQVISYELALGMSVVGVLEITGSLKLTDIISFQAHHIPNIFWQPLGFVIYCIAAIAEVNRAPFDLAEAEQELVAGYHIEYSSFRFAMFFMAEYINMITVSAFATTVFLGGPLGPFTIIWPWLSGLIWFLIKVVILLFIFIWLRATLPRVRYDRLMTLGWRWLIPLALLNILATAVVVALTA